VLAWCFLILLHKNEKNKSREEIYHNEVQQKQTEMKQKASEMTGRQYKRLTSFQKL
jgi:hypothetical protein